jgi:hypothetical protein
MMNAIMHQDTQRGLVQGPPAASSTQLNQPGENIWWHSRPGLLLAFLPGTGPGCPGLLRHRPSSPHLVVELGRAGSRGALDHTPLGVQVQGGVHHSLLPHPLLSKGQLNKIGYYYFNCSRITNGAATQETGRFARRGHHKLMLKFAD